MEIPKKSIMTVKANGSFNRRTRKVAIDSSLTDAAMLLLRCEDIEGVREGWER